MLCLALTACGGGSVAKTYSYTPPTTPGGRMCTEQCQMSSDYCRQGCDLSYRQCVGGVQSQALKDYDKYTREQYDEGQPIDLTLSDFERMSPCNNPQAACYSACDNKYGVCYSDCGGKVEVTKSCSPFCF
jgi:hypothetical protein